MDSFTLSQSVRAVRETTPLVHCITNYVTVNDVANALLAIGGSPIMSDEPADVADITTICDGLLINIGTLNERSIKAMEVAGECAAELGHPILLDPVGAGASALRTETAANLLDRLPVAVIRGNMSEIKALAGASQTTRGVDANPADAVTEENLERSAAFVREVAESTGSIVAVTGAIDLVASASEVYAIRNGDAMMSSITGSGCMLSAIATAYLCAGRDHVLEAVTTAVCLSGLAGERAAASLKGGEGVGTFRTALLDALTTIDGDELERGARLRRVLS